MIVVDARRSNGTDRWGAPAVSLLAPEEQTANARVRLIPCLVENVRNLRGAPIKAQRFAKDYWLYIVTDCRTDPKLHLVQDPAGKLTPKEEVQIVRYMVDDRDWKSAAAESTE